LAFAALILELAYVAVANTLLTSGVMEDLFSSGRALKVRYRLAWSLWPGFVHADGLRIVMQDRNVQFDLEIPKVDVRIRLRDVAHRTFHATRVRGDGIVFRLRQRIQPEAAGRPFVGALPPISGFADPPLRDSGPHPPPLDDAHYALWTVLVEDVDVAVHEIWVEMFRYQGHARAAGAFYLRPARRAWVGPAELSIASGDITAGAHEVMHGVEGRIGCRVDDLDIQAIAGANVFRYISARTRMTGQVTDLQEVTRLLAGPSHKLSLSGGGGPVDVDAAIEHGVFTPDTRLEFRTQHIGVTIDQARFRFDGELALLARGPSAGLPGRVNVSAPRAEVRLEGGTAPPVQLTDASASATTNSVDLTRLWSLGEGELRVGEATILDLRWLNDIPMARPPPWRAEGGLGTVRGAITLSRDHEVGGWAVVRVEQGSALAGDVRFRASADADATFTGNPSHPLRADVRLEARDVEVGQTGSGTCPWGKIESASVLGRIASGNDARADERGKEEGRAIRELRATLLGSSFRWGEFEGVVKRTSLAGQWNPGWMQARIDSIGLALRNAGGPPRSWQAHAASTSIDMVLAGTEGQTGGNVRIDVKQANGQVGKTKMGGDLVAQLAVASGDEPRTADISGTILAHDVTLSKGESRTAGWWAEVNLEHATLDTSRNFDIVAKGQARVQNGLPVLYLLSSKGESPSWLLSQLSRHTLTIDLDIRRFCRWTDVQIPRIEGGLLWAQGRVQAEPGQTYGAMLFRLAPLKLLSVGMTFYEDHSQSSLLVGADWLEKQVLPMSQAATTKRELGCEGPAPSCD